jgi:hypothetical protein
MKSIADPLFYELQANWTRCNIDKNLWVADREIVVSTLSSLRENTTQCEALRNTLQKNYNDMVTNTNTQTKTQTDQIATLTKKTQDNLMLGILIGAAIIGGIWWYTKSQEKRYDRPKEMRTMGFGSGVNRK